MDKIIEELKRDYKNSIDFFNNETMVTFLVTLGLVSKDFLN